MVLANVPDATLHGFDAPHATTDEQQWWVRLGFQTISSLKCKLTTYHVLGDTLVALTKLALRLINTKIQFSNLCAYCPFFWKSKSCKCQRTTNFTRNFIYHVRHSVLASMQTIIYLLLESLLQSINVCYIFCQYLSLMFIHFNYYIIQY